MRDSISALNPLLALERDLLRAYAVAEVQLRSHTLIQAVGNARLEHARHASDLTALVLQLGGQPRGRRHLRGPFWETWALLAAALSDQSALRALLFAEQAAERLYSQTIDAEVPPAAAPLVLCGLGEHRRRLAWLRPRVGRGASRVIQ